MRFKPIKYLLQVQLHSAPYYMTLFLTLVQIETEV